MYAVSAPAPVILWFRRLGPSQTSAAWE